MQELKVNILGVTPGEEGSAYEKAVDVFRQMAQTRYWNGKHVGPTLMMTDDDVLVVKGGRRRLQPHCIRFVQRNVEVATTRSYVELMKWQEGFDLLILVCNARKLLTDEMTLHRLRLLRNGMSVEDRLMDAYVLLTGVDEVMDVVPRKNYFYSMLDVMRALGDERGESEDVLSKLKPAYTERWNQLLGSMTAQETKGYRLKSSSKRFFIPTNMFCQVDALEFSGYQELMTTMLDRLVASERSFFGVVGTKRQYNMFDNLKKIFCSDKEVKLAVIGPTSSGKTYFLTDFVTALKRLGYEEVNHFDSDIFHYPISSFIADVQNAKSGVEKTPIFICRNTNQYSSLYVNRDNRKHKVMIDFVDVPGEVVTKQSLMLFLGIMTAMLGNKSKCFLQKSWQQEGDKSVRKTVEFTGQKVREEAPKPKPTPTPELALNPQDGIDLDDMLENEGGQQNTKVEDNLHINKVSSFVSTQAILKELEDSAWEVKKSTTISAKELFEHFTEFETDTAIQAIIDAWAFLGINNHISSVQGSKLFSDVNQGGDYKTQFDRVFKSHFYFHYYTYFATDVVICDKFVQPKSVVKAGGKMNAPDTQLEMMRALETMSSYADSHTSNKRWYYAFKGVDSIMQQDDFKLLFKNSGRDLNLVYSYFLLLFKKHFFESQGEVGPHAVKKYINNKEELSEYLSSKDLEEQVKDMLFDDLMNLENCWQKYFIDAEHYSVSGDLPLHRYVLNQVKKFMDIKNVLPLESDEDVSMMLDQLLAHVYFTATPIDDEFNIDQQDEQQPTLFKGQAKNPEYRVCFGTLQLASDILEKVNLPVKEEYDALGTLLIFVETNK